MKDTIIKGTGTSRFIKAPSSIPESFAAWRAQLLDGSATLDVSLNQEGCDVVGTPLNKENLLSDHVAEFFELSGDDPTPDQMFRSVPKIQTFTVTLQADGWEDSVPATQIVSVDGMTLNKNIVVTSAPVNYEAYCAAGIYCASQGNNTVTFNAITIPDIDLAVNIMMIGDARG